MPVSTDILESYVRPRQVFRRKLDGGTDEGRALATLIGACLLIFVAQWPGLARAAHADPAIPLDARMGGALMGRQVARLAGGFTAAAIPPVRPATP
jgi:hypothetical protein